MRRVIVFFLAVVGFLSILLAVGLGVGAWVLIDRLGEFSPLEASVPEPQPGSIIVLDLRTPPADGPEPDPVSVLLEDAQLTLHQTIEAIGWAAEDEDVAGMAVRFSGDTMGLATAQALQRAILDFRASGKPVIAQASSFGEFGPGTISYFTASAADTIAVQGGGSIGLTGLHASVPFAAETMELLSLQPDGGRRGRYKTAPEIVTESEMPAPHREFMESLVGDLFGQITTSIAENRNLAEPELLALIDQAPLSAEIALETGLIDEIASWQEIDRLLTPFGADRDDLFRIADYHANAADRGEPEGATAALIFAQGIVVEGDGDDSLFGGGGQMGADALAYDITAAADDDDLNAIILRVDSGGGSAVASEIIAQAIEYARGRGKPVIVSMGSVAASGAYWLATPATAIVAEGGTLTGSIGVFAGKIVTGALWDRLGVNWESVSRGEHAGMFSTIEPFSPDERERLEQFLDRVYGDFINRVAIGRGLAPEQVEQIAEGRVWTGAQAIELGLVDRLGGVEAAVAEAAGALDLGEDEPLALVTYPPARSLLDRAMSLMGTESEAMAAAALPGPLGELLRRLEAAAPRGTARMPALEINGIGY